MAKIHMLTYNPFQQNTAVVESAGECIVVDPGAYSDSEKSAFLDFLKQKNLKVVRLLNTHCHLDHIFANALVSEKFGLELEIHREEAPVLKAAPQIGQAYGIPLEATVEPGAWLEDGQLINFGEEELRVIFTPGHSPGSVSFYSESGKYIIGGDVLFREGIGRTDLPGGDFETLMTTLKEKFLTLPDDVVVYSGHGPKTTIGYERASNPFIREYIA